MTTRHIADITEYQGALKIGDLALAGFATLALKTSHGLGLKSVHPLVRVWSETGRSLGWGMASCHWLTGDASGTAQAEHAYRQLQALGLTARAAHVVDVEAGDITAKIYGDYVATMANLLGRPIVTYTGDWWAASRPWLKPSRVSPWLMGAPAPGYQLTYPGDDSPMWDDGYAGYSGLAIMQYRVAKVAGIKVSQSAVRDPDLWADMTGVPRMAWKTTPASDSLTEEMNAAFPSRDKASDGSIGDGEHSTRVSDHNPDETGTTPYEDADSSNEVHAKDLDSDLKRKGWTLFRVFEIIRKRKDSRVQNMICDGKITSRSHDFSEWRTYTGSDPHDTHGHISFRYGSGSGTSNPENITSPWGILAAVQQEEDVPLTQAEIDKIVNGVAAKVPGAVLGAKYGSKSYEGRTVAQALQDLHGARDYMIGDAKAPTVGAGAPLAQLKLLPTLLAAIQSGSIDVDALAQALAPVLAPLIPDDQDVTPEVLREAFRGL